MALGIFLIAISLAVLVYGLIKRSKKVIVSAVIMLTVVAAIWVA